MKNWKSIVLLAAVFVFAAAEAQAQNWWKSRIRGEGKSVTQALEVGSFDGISLQINADVLLVQSTDESVEIHAQENIIENLETTVENGIWKIKYDRPVWRAEPVKIRIKMRDLTKIAISGSGNVTSDSRFTNLGNLDLAISGSGNIQLSCGAKVIASSISGSGDMALDGNAESLQVAISGSGDVNAGNLTCASAEIRISGAGDVAVHATDNLDVRTSGSGDVRYKGNPKVNSRSSGSGSVRAM